MNPTGKAGKGKTAGRRAKDPAKDPAPPFRYDDLRALFLNCTLKRSGEDSHTERLIHVPATIMRRQGVRVGVLRPVDLDLAPGVQPDMTKHGFERDEWPKLRRRVMAADILVLCTPIWLGEESSVCRRVIERLYSESGKLNDAGQYVYYGRVGGALVTGNEDGIKHCSMSLLYALQHLGYAIPPQADAGWIGEAGPGPSYGDDGAGYDNDFTQRNATFLAWNLMHLARLLKDAGGFPAHGNQRSAWEAGARFDHPDTQSR
ncbi:flavodoxin family protein [Luteimonas pelagia]